MPFPKRYAEIAHKLRVPLGFAVAAAYLILARPSWRSLAWGGAIALLGLVFRAWAAGHLAKNETLAASGPYAHVRNPLYVGSLITAAGFALAGRNLAVAGALAVYFLFFFLPVVEEEERHLRKLFPEYAEYERRVPKFWPRLARQGGAAQEFRWAIYHRNREYQAVASSLAAMAILLLKAWLGGS
jgi:protein-S-isoprenylcysteine O-methyltransferase Ste14